MIVVGCGPAGATAARVAADSGRSVLIIDRKRSVGQPPRCAGFVPSWLPPYAGVDESAVIQPITQVCLSQGEFSTTVGVDGCVIDRTRFDKTLAIHALESGADLCNGFVIRRKDRTLVARRNGVEATFGGGAIVCADGASSVVSRSMARNRRRFLATMQLEIGLDEPCTQVTLRRPVIEGRGLGWFIPSGRTAKIGVALPRALARLLKPALSRFVRTLGKDALAFENATLGATGGLVPVDRRPLTDASLCLVVAGDARGGLGVDGAGIANAVLSGELAGHTVDRFLTNNSEDVIETYPASLDRLLRYGRAAAEEKTLTSSFEKWVGRTRDIFVWRPEHVSMDAAS